MKTKSLVKVFPDLYNSSTTEHLHKASDYVWACKLIAAKGVKNEDLSMQYSEN